MDKDRARAFPGTALAVGFLNGFQACLPIAQSQPVENKRLFPALLPLRKALRSYLRLLRKALRKHG